MRSAIVLYRAFQHYGEAHDDERGHPYELALHFAFPALLSIALGLDIALGHFA